MSNTNDVTLSTNSLPSDDYEDELLKANIGKYIEGDLDSRSLFWGILESFTEYKIFLRSEQGLVMVIKRNRIARLVVG